MANQLVVIFIIAVVSSVVLGAAWRFGCETVGLSQSIAFGCAVLAVVWTAASGLAAIGRRPGRGDGPAVDGPTLESGGMPGFKAVAVGLTRYAALGFAVIPATVACFVLVVHTVALGIDLAMGDRLFSGISISLATLHWTLIALLAACLLAEGLARDRRLVTCRWWIVTALLLWWYLTRPPFVDVEGGVAARSPASVHFALLLGAFAWVHVVLQRWWDRRRRWWLAMTQADLLTVPRHGPPGWSISLAALQLGLLVLTAYHLAVPVAMEEGAYATTMRLVSLAAVLGATAGFLSLTFRFHRVVGELSMGLMSLGMASLAVGFIPDNADSIASRYPVIFAATIIGLAASALLWAWLYGVWLQQLDDGKPWTIAGRLIPSTARFSFMSAALAIVVACLLAFWPRLQGIPASDDTLASVLSGLGANLFLLLITLWTARRFTRHTFHFLALLAVTTTVAFVISRVLPFSTHFD